MLQFEDYTLEEQQAIKKLKSRISPDELPERTRNDETFYYRFLKARDFNIKNAEAMIRKHLKDYARFAIDDNLNGYVAPEKFKTYIPSSFLGYDKEGSVVRYLDIGQTDVKGIVSMATFMESSQYVLDYLEKDIDRMTEQARKRRKSVTKTVVIANMEKLNLFQCTYKKGLEWALEGCKLYQDNYPERVKAIYVINASYYFNIAFSILKTVLNDGLLQKIQIFNKDGWQEALLEIIEADDLPAFLGGNKLDPEGNPLCNSFIIHGKKVPEELYLKKKKITLKDEIGVHKLTVSRFCRSELFYYVYEPNTLIEWEFEIKCKDIAFGLCFKNNRAEHSELEELIPKQRIDTEIASETGVYTCDKVGTYIIVFDNSYSWMSSKEVYYRIRLIKPNERKIEMI